MMKTKITLGGRGYHFANLPACNQPAHDTFSVEIETNSAPSAAVATGTASFFPVTFDSTLSRIRVVRFNCRVRIRKSHNGSNFFHPEA